jgi:hypothetical protein
MVSVSVISLESFVVTTHLTTLPLLAEGYDEDHVPLRMSRCGIKSSACFHKFFYHLFSELSCNEHRFPEFETVARYEAIDGHQPGFAAIYTVTSLSSLCDEPRYKSLRANRSEREADILTRISTVDRRTCRSIQLERRPSAVKNHSFHPYILTVELTRPALPELLTELRSFDGWIKTEVGEIVASSVIGHLQPPSTDPRRTPQYILISGQ